MTIITVADAKQQLNIIGTAHDAELQVYVDAADRVCEYFAGIVTPRAVTETHDGGRCEIVLRQLPVISITTVKENGVTLDSSEYSLASSGVLTRVSGTQLAFFLPGTAVVEVEYQAGRSPVPANITVAARMLVQHWWATQRQGTNLPRLAEDDVLTIPGVAWSIPIRVVQLLDPERIPGIA